jgi:Trp operon repressor
MWLNGGMVALINSIPQTKQKTTILYLIKTPDEAKAAMLKSNPPGIMQPIEI